MELVSKAKATPAATSTATRHADETDLYIPVRGQLRVSALVGGVAALAVALGMILAGCGSGSSSEEPSPSEQPSTSAPASRATASTGYRGVSRRRRTNVRIGDHVGSAVGAAFLPAPVLITPSRWPVAHNRVDGHRGHATDGASTSVIDARARCTAGVLAHRWPSRQPTARMTCRVTSRIRAVNSGGNGSEAGSGTSTVVVTTPRSSQCHRAPNRSRSLRIG